MIFKRYTPIATFISYFIWNISFGICFMLPGLRSSATKSVLASRAISSLPFGSKSNQYRIGTKLFAAHTISMVPGEFVSKTDGIIVTHPSYEVIKQDFVKEYGAKTVLYRHRQSGAEVLSVEADDDNKVFGITFRTPPEDSTGIAHILEHSVLCGSRKYPVKEPFVDLLKGSLQTFLNAFTYPDRTCYPVASQNIKDFYNLVNVYLDAVFFPRAVSDPMVFAQEGWHYEIEKPEDPLVYKGVVFNEMKGSYSSPDSLNSVISLNALFPSNAYSVSSGGDPRHIPNLTYEYFQNFHKKFYHPSNSRIYFYGDDSVEKRLELLDEYLKEFDYRDCNKDESMVKWQKKIDTPWKHSAYFATNEDGIGKHMVSVNWLLNDSPLSKKEKLALNILDDLLVGNSAAMLKKELTDSGFGSSVIGGGLSDELLQATFSIGLKGVSTENVEKVETLILDILDKCAKNGFEQSAIAASLNTIEFDLREFNTGSFPRGLSLMLGSVSNWIYDFDPTEEFHFESSLTEIKEDLKSGIPVFQNLLRKLIVENGHRVTVEMKPSLSYSKELDDQEKLTLEKAKSKMSPEKINNEIKQTQKLKELQAAEDSLEAKGSIPSLNLSDLERNIKKVPIDIYNWNDVKIVKHALPTSGIIYADIGFDFTSIPLSEYPLLGLFSKMILETGTNEMSQVELTRHISTQTGGIYCSNILGTKLGKDGNIPIEEEIIGYLFIRGKAVSDKSSEMMNIIKMIANDSKLDAQQRAIEILKESKARFESSIIGSGHSFAATRINSRYTLEAYLNEISGGVSSIQNINEFLKMAQDDWPFLHSRLQNIRKMLIKKENLIINLTGDLNVLKDAEKPIQEFIASFPVISDVSIQRALWKNEINLLPIENEGFAVQTQVNYVGKGGRLFMPGEIVPGSHQVVSRYLRNGYLWDNVRVMGGAYGGFCIFDPFNGMFSFVSYRDPNISKTISIYDKCADYLTSLNIPKEELELSIIGAVGDMDSPQSSDQKGFTSLKRHLIGMSDEDRQRIRNEILSTNTQDFLSFGNRLQEFNKHSRCAVIGSQNSLSEANQDIDDADLKFKINEI